MNAITFARVSGESMLPLINDSCTLQVIYEDNQHYRMGDLVIYLDDTLLVCHRVLCRLPGDHLLLKGDNTRRTDGIYSSHDILGKVKKIHDQDLIIQLDKGRHRWLKYAFVAYSIFSLFLPSFISYSALARFNLLNQLYHKMIRQA